MVVRDGQITRHAAVIGGAVVLKANADATSEMVVIEAQNFHAAPVARMRIPARVLYGFHGAWIAGDTLEKQG